MATRYTYSIEHDFPHGVATDRFSAEISASAIVTALDHIDTASDDCDVYFKADLSAGDKTLLDGLVASHSGQPLPPDVPTVKLDAQMTQDGRITVRQTTANKGTNYRLRCITFYTADPSKLHNKSIDGTDLVDVTIKCYDADGDLCTGSAPYADAVKTVLDFEPHYDYEIIGGGIDVPRSLQDGTTDAWYAACTALPDVPAEMGGSVPFVNQCNLEAVTTPELDLDGRATVFLKYDAQYHTNKLRFEILHPAGASRRFQVYLEKFK